MKTPRSLFNLCALALLWSAICALPMIGCAGHQPSLKIYETDELKDALSDWRGERTGLLWLRRDAHTIYLETIPVDPRDLWSGQYMTLRYQIENDPRLKSPSEKLGILLTPTKEIQTSAGLRSVYTVQEVRPAKDVSEGTAGNSVWVIGDVGNESIHLGINRFYFNDTVIYLRHFLRKQFGREIGMGPRDEDLRPALFAAHVIYIAAHPITVAERFTR